MAMAINTTLLFTPEAMAKVDARVIASGIPGPELMRAAGASVVACLLSSWPNVARAVVLCGPGNNGGDGHIAASLLAAFGVPVLRHGYAPRSGTDAAAASATCEHAILPLGDYRPLAGDVVIDALFGAGLDRAVGAEVAAVIGRIAEAGTPVLAIDLPSGLSGRTGRPTGPVISAERTVTFAGLKPGHVLMPGRELCGVTTLADIGMPARLVASDDPLWINGPHLYGPTLPRREAADHKYSRGHLAVMSGPLISGGAARLSAMAGLRIGAGLVTLGTPPGAVMAQSAHLTAIMQHRVGSSADLAAWLSDPRLSALVLGPGFGDLEKARDYAKVLANARRYLVLDADGLTAFAGRTGELGDMFAGETRLVITPHEGEFRRLFPAIAEDETLSKVDRARQAAALLNAVVVYKGADTVIAASDGRAAINADAPPWLATAGSGDVLSGVIGGLLAQSMPIFEAACAGVALHGAAASQAGPGMTAEDLAGLVRPPAV
ncbi:hydroxyethylthiazole kinase-like uncharacterized protein yjeF/hydroxyethylthiazole kinase-like uncharacterized protein yjeF [Hoeflea marina]|uniref:Bifunctional NAD(P)H-hydrate repair enzyme n=2 Tax=Hoeflea marina TaxID=274592 RepID=A0A317PR49_9HYPH|nr:NAD(P)H-hydrate dehydratase [Hoeflea marina]PWW03961.1 hydroxyethylthiazole kinase-like uncharacterized protein yjeF/hydroxyethylthiazole kinase-like uncharacterized protein yjeF [Hoeflea marina]